MKRISSSGQILPITLFMIPILLFFITANGERLFRTNEKVQNQRKADALLLHVATQQARALNAVAALNQGLQIAKERAYILAAAITSLGLCAALTLFASPCTRALASLSKSAPTFFKKLMKLGREMARSQDELLQWAEKIPKQTISFSNLLSRGNAWAVVTPSRILAHRSSTLLRGNFERQAFFEGKDLKRCHKQTLGRSEYDSLEKLTIGKHDELNVTYSSWGDPNRTKRLNHADGRELYNDGLHWSYQSATFRKCESFNDLLQKMNNGEPLRFYLPPPYVLKTSFNANQRIAIARMSHQNSPFPRIKNPVPSWSFSEARPVGSTLSKMKFTSVLTKVTLVRRIYDEIDSSFLGRSMKALYGFPRRKDVEQSITH